VNAPQLQITDQLFKTNLTFALFVFLLCRLTSGDRSSTPTLRRKLKKDPIDSSVLNPNLTAELFYHNQFSRDKIQFLLKKKNDPVSAIS
jgi:hypothetical protein